MKYLSVDDIVHMHDMILRDYGGLGGIRDIGRLESVVQSMKQVAYGEELYPTVFDKAAVLMRNIIADHPFADGNKRTAITTAGIFLMQNGQNLKAAPQELEDFAVCVATDHLSVPDIANWLEHHVD